VIVLKAGKRAILGTQLLYWLDPELLRRAKIPAPAGKRQATVTAAVGVPAPHIELPAFERFKSQHRRTLNSDPVRSRARDHCGAPYMVSIAYGSPVQSRLRPHRAASGDPARA
jgi:hypothetical protein